jgi:ABC-type sugar transport system permease subunit
MFKIIKRLFLYQIFFVFAYFKSRDIHKSALEFKDKFYGLTSYFNVKHQAVDKAFQNPDQTFQIYLIVQAALAFIAVLGVNFFGLLLAILLSLNTLIYEVKLPKLEGRKFDINDLQNILTFDVILNVVVILAILTSVLSGCGGCKKQEQAKVEPLNERSKGPSSGKKKAL